jgi:hypothetical protein
MKLFCILFILFTSVGCSANYKSLSNPAKNNDTSIFAGKENTTQIETTLNWAFSLSILATGIGIVLLFLKPTLGVTVLGSGLVGSLLSASAIRYFDALLLLGGIALLAALVFGYIYVYRQRKALFENVKLIEKIKPALSDGKVYEVFGSDGLAENIQSPDTKKIVKKMRKKVD